PVEGGRMKRASWIPLRPAVLCFAITLAGCVPNSHEFVPDEGDLLFQDLDGSPICDAIEKVTFGVDGAGFCHVGIATADVNGEPAVIEAYDTVEILSLNDFLARARDEAGRPRVVVGRLKERYRSLIPAAIRHARGLIGAPYDPFFLPDNGRFYCSELVSECFRDPDGNMLFGPAPMNFKESSGGEPMAIWKDYFFKLGTPVPEGVPGMNPGALSRSDRISIIHAYGRPRGWDETTWRRFGRQP
ncbi:MAG: hypothetical protein JXA41_00365, partial [Deltaproteobacteria bacterium]|nr:hypothetical protein [Deltaproteobacteria bacterium]